MAGLPAFSRHDSGRFPDYLQWASAAWRRLALLGAAVLLTACATPQQYAASPAFLKAPAAEKPKKVLLLPPAIDVMEISAGGVPEKVDAWSNQAKANIRQSLQKVTGAGKNFELIGMPQLTLAEKETVEKFLAFYDVVGSTAFAFGRSADPAWQHKAKNFDYTLGPGLHFLKQKTGADAALFIVGFDQISTGERKAAMIVGALLGIGLPAGVTFVSAGLVDLDSGNILWLNYDFGAGNWDIRDPADTDKLVANIFRGYPVGK